MMEPTSEMLTSAVEIEPTSVDYASGILQQVYEGQVDVLQNPYQEYKTEFMAFCQRFGASREDILDAYQDAFVALIENVQHRGIRTLKSSLKTYVFGIGKFILFKKLKRAGRTLECLELEDDALEYLDGYEEKDELTQNQRDLKKGLALLGGKCHEILRLFYYRQFSIEMIRTRMGYLNDNTVKAHKSRCMKKLRDLVKELNSKR